MLNNGQKVILYLGEDRRLYIDHSPGKTICKFEARIFNNPKLISIIRVPESYDGDKVYPPTGYALNGLNDE